MNIEIRDASAADKDTIVRFNMRMAEETEGRALDPSLVSAGVAAVLSDGNNGHYWVAEISGEMVGQLLITREWSDWRNGILWWIQSVYVKPAFRRQGVFSALYRHVESTARANAAVCGIRLYVEEGNRNAQATYLSLGMCRPGYQVMEIDFTKSEESKRAKTR